MRLLLNWLLSALALLIVAHVVPGFYIRGFLTALLAAVVIGLVNATLGLFLKVITLPLTVLTLGIFWFVINALMLLLASALGLYPGRLLAEATGAPLAAAQMHPAGPTHQFPDVNFPPPPGWMPLRGG